MSRNERTPRSAAIYCRISRDDGTALGVSRQETDCRAWCEDKGWAVSEVLTDNDVSAFSGKARPGYGRLLAGLQNGTYDAVVAWHPDRLHRSLVELEGFIVVVEGAKVPVATVTAGDFDLATPEGRLVARITGSVARKESEDKSRRLRRKHAELAEAGKLSGGGRRPFGYEKDRMTIRQDEAKEIRKAAERIMAGESLRSVTADLRERVPTVTGTSWNPTTLRRLLCSGRIAGQRSHNGVDVSPAAWPPIIDSADSMKLRAILGKTRPSATDSAARSYLLTGFLVCGRCGHRMLSAPVKRKGIRYRRYSCPRDRGGCGRGGISAERTEEVITEAVLSALDTPSLTELISRESDQDDGTEEVQVLEQRLTEAAEMFAAGEIRRADWATVRSSLEARLDAAWSAVADGAAQKGRAAYRGQLEGIRDRWSVLSLEQRRTVIGSVLTKVTVQPAAKGTNRFDGSRLDFTGSWL